MRKNFFAVFFVGVGLLAACLGAFLWVSKHRQTALRTLPPQIAHQQMAAEELKMVQSSQTSTGVTPKAQAVEIPDVSSSHAFDLLVSSKEDGHCLFIQVKAHDTLTAIAKKYNTTPEFIRKINQLSGNKLVVGQKLKVPTYKFSLVIDKSQNILMLKGNEEVLKIYTAATGLNNSTPVGTFKITNKLRNPTWYKPGAVLPFGSPGNELGTRWLGLDKKGYGIHGTIHPESLGRQVTAGCVRLRNEDVEAIFDMVPLGTEVTIVD